MYIYILYIYICYIYIYIYYIYTCIQIRVHIVYIYIDESSHMLQQTNSKLISIDALKKTFKIRRLRYGYVSRLCRCFSNCQTWLYIVIHMIDRLKQPIECEYCIVSPPSKLYFQFIRWKIIYLNLIQKFKYL